MSGDTNVHHCSGHIINEDDATVYGDKNTVNGDNSRVNGADNTVNGDNAVVRGNGNVVNGDNATIEGDHNVVTGDEATVRGDDNLVSGDQAVVHGARNTVTGDARVVIGDSNFVTPEDHPPPAPAAPWQINLNSSSVGVSRGARGAVAAVRWRAPRASDTSVTGGAGMSVTNIGVAPDLSTLFSAAASPAVPMDAEPARASRSRSRSRSRSMTLPDTGTLRDALQKMLDRDRPFEEGAEDRVQCVICYERIKCVAFDPCGHVEACVACALQLVKPGGQELECPVCKESVGGAAFARV